MSKYLIEIPHKDDKDACVKAIQVFLNTGSHFLANADWGCEDGEHKAWFVLDIEDKEHARQIIPPAFRHQAKITKLTRFTMDQLKDMEPLHR